MTGPGKAQVARRRVFYIPGYDPYPPRRYRELYRKEGLKQAEISGFKIAQKQGQSDTGWQVRGEIGGSTVNAKIDVLVWNDLVKGSMQRGLWATYGALLRTSWVYVSSGTLRRLSWLSKGPILAALYPVAMLFVQLAIALGLAGLAGGIAGRLILNFGAWVQSLFGGGPVSDSFGWGLVAGAAFWGLALPVAVVALRWFRDHDDRVYAHYLMHDYAYTAQGAGAYPDEIEARLIEFRHRVEAALRSEVDEVLIVGHSSGAQLAVSLVADLVRSNHFREGGPALSLLTLGQVIPMVSFLPKAQRLRRDLRLLSKSEQITWLDVSAPGDGCCFALSDPVSVSGVAPATGQKWPIVISAAFSQTLKPDTLAAMRHRYFRLHFQYLCAFDRPGDYDYFKITAGPLTLGQRFEGRTSSKSRIDVSASRFTSITDPA